MENLGGWGETEDHPDFDPNLLNVDSWAVDHQADDVHVTDQHQHQHDTTSDNRNNRLPSRKKSSGGNNNSWGDNRHDDQWSALGVTDFDHHEDTTASTSKQNGGSSSSNNNCNNNNLHLQRSSGVEGIPNGTVEAAVEAAVAAISETADSVTSGDRSGSENNNNAYNNNINLSQHLHPLGIQSSASCPAPVHTNGSSTFHQQQQQQQQQQVQQQQQQQHSIQGVCGVGLNQPSTVSTTAGAPAATFTPTITHTSSVAATQHLSSLAANFMLAQSANSNVAATAAAASAAANATSQEHHQQHHTAHTHTASVISQPSSIPNSSSVGNNESKPKTSRAASSRQRNNSGTRQSKSTKSKKKKANSTNNASSMDSNALPPFYLFDAPIELRANFMQNQRRLGLPIQHDPNSYHYGETVNGFHPHQYSLPFGAENGSGGAGAGLGVPPPNARPSNAPPPQLIDARNGNHRKNRGGQVKNEREQKRAQKITELIEQLRLQMEQGGWQVEARSKFHTLSNCAQYIKHMIQLTSDKKNENQKLNSELDEKRHKLEREDEEKAMQEGRSDPESVTSSLTSDTTMSTARHKQQEETSGESGGDDDTKKRKLPSNDGNREGGSSGDDSNNNLNDANNNSHSSSSNNSNKKHRISSSEATTEDSSGDDNRGGSAGTGSGSSNSRTGSGSGGSGGISKTISSVSELTDSNRGSSSNNSGGGISDDLPTEQDSRESTSGNREDGVDQPSISSISSDAAVASEKTSRDRNTGHKDVVFNNDKRMGRKRPPEEVTSLERTFELNYEEVFHKSNIPQLIATTSGKIVTWNQCFGKATGFRKSEIERMTIFSLVKPENLANFFEIVAAALRPDNDEIAEESINNSTVTNSSGEDSLSGRDTVICSNNDKDGGEQGGNKNPEMEKNGCDDVDSVTIRKEGESSANSTSEGSSSNSTEEEGGNKIDTLSKESHDSTTQNDTNGKENMKPEEDANVTENGKDEMMPKRLLNYTAMTLPCIDFPAMIKRNQAATESNSVLIPALHVTITLMKDKDPSRRCFHCVFTNSKGTNGSLGIITPELLASLFATPLRTGRRKKHYSSHGASSHQRKRSRGGTTRVGQSVSTSTAKPDEEKHCVQQIVSTNEEFERPPSPLLMPPPGPPLEDNSKQEESESKGMKIELSD